MEPTRDAQSQRISEIRDRIGKNAIRILQEQGLDVPSSVGGNGQPNTQTTRVGSGLEVLSRRLDPFRPGPTTPYPEDRGGDEPVPNIPIPGRTQNPIIDVPVDESVPVLQTPETSPTAPPVRADIGLVGGTINETRRSFITARRDFLLDQLRQVVENEEKGYKSVFRPGKLGDRPILPDLRDRVTDEEQEENVQSLLASIVDLTAKANGIPVSEALARFQEPDDLGALLIAAGKNPSALIQSGASSIAQSIPSIASTFVGMALAGPGGAAVGSFLGSLSTEQLASFSGFLQNEGINLEDPDQILFALANDQLREELKSKAARKGFGVAITEGIFGKATGKIAASAMGTVAKELAGTAVDIVGEGVGEAVGSFVAGEEVSATEAVRESLSAGPQAAATAGATIAGERRRQRREQRQQQRTETPTPDVVVETPEVETPEVETPEVETPEVETPEVETPTTPAFRYERPEEESQVTIDGEVNTVETIIRDREGNVVSARVVGPDGVGRGVTDPEVLSQIEVTPAEPQTVEDDGLTEVARELNVRETAFNESITPVVEFPDPENNEVITTGGSTYDVTGVNRNPETLSIESINVTDQETGDQTILDSPEVVQSYTEQIIGEETAFPDGFDDVESEVDQFIQESLDENDQLVSNEIFDSFDERSDAALSAATRGEPVSETDIAHAQTSILAALDRADNINDETLRRRIQFELFSANTLLKSAERSDVGIQERTVGQEQIDAINTEINQIVTENPEVGEFFDTAFSEEEQAVFDQVSASNFDNVTTEQLDGLSETIASRLADVSGLPQEFGEPLTDFLSNLQTQVDYAKQTIENNIGRRQGQTPDEVANEDVGPQTDRPGEDPTRDGGDDQGEGVAESRQGDEGQGQGNDQLTDEEQQTPEEETVSVDAETGERVVETEPIRPEPVVVGAAREAVVESVNRVVKNVVGVIDPNIKITVLESAASANLVGLDPADLMFTTDSGDLNVAAGVFIPTDNRIVFFANALNADNLDSDVATVFAEEYVVHYGLRKLLGPDFDRTMVNLFDAMDFRLFADAVELYQFQLRDVDGTPIKGRVTSNTPLSNESKIILVEEYMGGVAAKSPETLRPTERTRLTQVIQNVRRFLNNIGLSIVGTEDAEIRQLLKLSAENLRRSVDKSDVDTTLTRLRKAAEGPKRRAELIRGFATTMTPREEKLVISGILPDRLVNALRKEGFSLTASDNIQALELINQFSEELVVPSDRSVFSPDELEDAAENIIFEPGSRGDIDSFIESNQNDEVGDPETLYNKAVKEVIAEKAEALETPVKTPTTTVVPETIPTPTTQTGDPTLDLVSAIASTSHRREDGWAEVDVVVTDGVVTAVPKPFTFYHVGDRPVVVGKTDGERAMNWEFYLADRVQAVTLTDRQQDERNRILDIALALEDEFGEGGVTFAYALWSAHDGKIHADITPELAKSIYSDFLLGKFDGELDLYRNAITLESLTRDLNNAQNLYDEISTRFDEFNALADSGANDKRYVELTRESESYGGYANLLRSLGETIEGLVERYQEVSKNTVMIGGVYDGPIISTSTTISTGKRILLPVMEALVNTTHMVGNSTTETVNQNIRPSIMTVAARGLNRLAGDARVPEFAEAPLTDSQIMFIEDVAGFGASSNLFALVISERDRSRSENLDIEETPIKKGAGAFRALAEKIVTSERTPLPPDIQTEEEAVSFVIDEGSVADLFHEYHTRASVTQNDAMKEAVLTGDYRISTESFKTFGDPNFLSDYPKSALRWFSPEGRSIDVLAEELAREFGRRVTPNTIVELIMENPDRNTSVLYEDPVKTELSNRFKELTGYNIADKQLVGVVNSYTPVVTTESTPVVVREAEFYEDSFTTSGYVQISGEDVNAPSVAIDLIDRADKEGKDRVVITTTTEENHGNARPGFSLRFPVPVKASEAQVMAGISGLKGIALIQSETEKRLGIVSGLSYSWTPEIDSSLIKSKETVDDAKIRGLETVESAITSITEHAESMDIGIEVTPEFHDTLVVEKKDYGKERKRLQVLSDEFSGVVPEDQTKSRKGGVFGRTITTEVKTRKSGRPKTKNVRKNPVNPSRPDQEIIDTWSLVGVKATVPKTDKARRNNIRKQFDKIDEVLGITSVVGEDIPSVRKQLKDVAREIDGLSIEFNSHPDDNQGGMPSRTQIVVAPGPIRLNEKDRYHVIRDVLSTTRLLSEREIDHLPVHSSSNVKYVRAVLENQRVILESLLGSPIKDGPWATYIQMELGVALGKMVGINEEAMRWASIKPTLTSPVKMYEEALSVEQDILSKTTTGPVDSKGRKRSTPKTVPDFASIASISEYNPEVPVEDRPTSEDEYRAIADMVIPGTAVAEFRPTETSEVVFDNVDLVNIPEDAPDNSYDFVISSRFLNNVPKNDRTAELEEIIRVLKPGGQAIITVRKDKDVKKTAVREMADSGYIVSDGSFKKGYRSPTELKNEVQEVLGESVTVEPVTQDLPGSSVFAVRITKPEGYTGPQVRFSRRFIRTPEQQNAYINKTRDTLRGRKTVKGRPDLANPGQTQVERLIVDQVDEIRNELGDPEIQKIRDTKPKAISRVDADLDGEWKNLLDNRIRNMEDQLVAQEIITRKLGQTDPNTNQELIDLGRMIYDYRELRGDVARALATGYDPTLSPEERRRRYILHAYATPPKDIRDRLDKAQTKAEMNAIWDEYAKRMTEADKVLAGKGINIHNLTEEDLNDMVKMAEIMRVIQAASSSTGDRMFEYWINAILSAPTTHMANIVGNIGNTGWEFFVQKTFEATINQFMGKRPDRATFGELKTVMQTIAGRPFKMMFATALRRANLAWKIEQPILESEVDEKGIVRVDKLTKSIGGKKGRVIRVPTRALLWTDEFLKSITFHMEATALAYRMASQEGLTGDQREARIAQILSNPQSEAFQDLYHSAFLKARNLAFQDPLKAQVLNDLAKKNSDDAVSSMVKWFFPFITTPTNILKKGVKLSPFGSARLVYKGIKHIRYGFDPSKTELRYDSEEAFRDVAEALAANAVFFGLMFIMGGQDEDEPWITGSEPDFITQGGELELSRRAIPAMSIKIPGTSKYISYARIEPFATSLVLAVDTIRGIKRLGEEGGDVSDALADGIDTMRGLVQDKSFFQGVSNLMDLIFGSGNKVANFLSNTVASFSPNIIRRGLGATDPVFRDNKIRGDGIEFWRELATRTGQKAFPLPALAQAAKVDMWGRPAEKSPNALSSPASRFVIDFLSPVRVASTDRVLPVDRMLTNYVYHHPNAETRLPLPTAPADKFKWHGREIQMNDEQYKQFMTFAGEFAYRMIGNYPFNIENPTERDVEVVRNAYSKGKEMAKLKILQQMINDGSVDLSTRP